MQFCTEYIIAKQREHQQPQARSSGVQDSGECPICAGKLLGHRLVMGLLGIPRGWNRRSGNAARKHLNLHPEALSAL